MLLPKNSHSQIKGVSTFYFGEIHFNPQHCMSVTTILFFNVEKKGGWDWTVAKGCLMHIIQLTGWPIFIHFIWSDHIIV